MAFVGEDIIPEEPISRNCLEDVVLPRVKISAPVFVWTDDVKQTAYSTKSKDKTATTSGPSLTATAATAATAASATTATTSPAIAAAAAPCLSRTRPDLLVIGLAGVGQCFLTAQLRRAERIGDASKKPSVVATMSSPRAKCSLLRLRGVEGTAAPRVMMAVFEDHVEANQSFLWAKTLFHHVQPSRVVVLDEYKADTFIKRKKEKWPELPFVRMLKSSALHKIVLGLSLDKSTKIRELNSPNIVEGLPAAFLSRCEVHGIPAAVIVSAMGLQAELENVECLSSAVAFLDAICPGASAHLGGATKADLLQAWTSMRKSTTRNLYL